MMADLRLKFGSSIEDMKDCDAVIKLNEGTPEGFWDVLPEYFEKYGLKAKVIK